MTEAALAVLKRLRGRPYATASTRELATDQRKVTLRVTEAALVELEIGGYVVRAKQHWELTTRGRRYGYELSAE